MLPSVQSVELWGRGVGWGVWGRRVAWAVISKHTHMPDYSVPLFTVPSSHPGKGIIGPILQMRKPRGKEVIKVVPNLQLGGDTVGV